MTEIDDLIKEYTQKITDSLKDLYVESYIQGARDCSKREKKQSIYDSAMDYYWSQYDWIASHLEDTDTNVLLEKLGTALEEGQSFTTFWKETRDSGMFDRSRAERIFRTEMNRAYSEGTIKEYEKEGVKAVEILLGPNPCDECQEIADNGPYPTEDVEGMYPIHPNCSCVITNAEFAPEETFGGTRWSENELFDQADELMDATDSDERERGQYFYGNKESGDIVRGGKHTVDMTYAYGQIPRELKIVEIHTHPWHEILREYFEMGGKSPPSAADIVTLSNTENQTASIIRDPEGNLFILKRTPETIEGNLKIDEFEFEKIYERLRYDYYLKYIDQGFNAPTAATFAQSNALIDAGKKVANYLHIEYLEL